MHKENVEQREWMACGNLCIKKAKLYNWESKKRCKQNREQKMYISEDIYGTFLCLKVQWKEKNDLWEFYKA